MGKSNLRIPVAAGKFYPAAEAELKNQVQSFIPGKVDKLDALGCILPHAGYVYSGGVAGETLARVNLKKRIVLLGPNHTGDGSPYSIMTEGTWQTPLGDVQIDSGLARLILKGSRYLENDLLAHLDEHSLEVELPFLQYLRPDLKIVPIALSCDNAHTLKEIGLQIAEVLKNDSVGKDIMFVASSDLTHYEPQKDAERKDKEVIGAILELDPDKLTQRFLGLGVSMCGYAPVMALLYAAKSLGARNGRLIKYQTSGDVTGDYEAVVGYAGIIIY